MLVARLELKGYPLYLSSMEFEVYRCRREGKLLPRHVMWSTKVRGDLYVVEQVDKAKQTLLQAELRLAGLNMILKTRQGVQLRKKNRMEQRHTDEFAALVHTRTRARSLSGETT